MVLEQLDMHRQKKMNLDIKLTQKKDIVYDLIYIKFSNRQFMVIGVRIVVACVGWKLTERDHRGTFWCDENV